MAAPLIEREAARKFRGGFRRDGVGRPGAQAQIMSAQKDPGATRYETLSFDEAIAKNLGVLDTAAFALCREQKLTLVVFNAFKPGALKRVVMGEDEGTRVTP